MRESFRSSDARAADGSLETEQRVLAPAPVVPLSKEGGERLGRTYWAAVTRATCGLVRTEVEESEVAVRFPGVRRPLLRFGPAQVEVRDDLVACRYPILSGLLVRRPGGALVLAQRGGEPAVLYVAVTGFFGRLGSGLAYRHLQRRLHVSVSARYFGALLGEHR